MTACGRIATGDGDSRWISSAETRRLTRIGRGDHDAILVGRGTVIRDDPRLTCDAEGRANPLRVVLDSRLAVDAHHQLVKSVSAAPLLVATRHEADAAQDRSDRARRLAALEAAGVEVLRLPAGEGGVDLGCLLDALGARGVAHLLVEGGPRVHGSFLDAGLVDRVQIILAPKLVGGAGAPPPVAGRGVSSMANALDIGTCVVEPCGPDVILKGSLSPAGRGDWTHTRPGC